MSRPSVAVVVFLFKNDSDNRILIGKRKGSLGAGLIAHPGGHLEHGETFESCAEREVMEETGLSIENVRFLTATTTILQECNKQYVTMWMTAITSASVSASGDPQEPQLLEPEKCEGWSWCTFAEMEEMTTRGHDLFEPVKDLMKQRPQECDKIRIGPSMLP